MQLQKIFKDLKSSYKKHSFSGISFNSNQCKKGDIFFAIKGKDKNGNIFIDHAIKKGAKTIISDIGFEGFKEDILFLKHNNPRALLAVVSNKIFKKKPKNITAVTGTNGKSSIADFYLQILNLNNLKCASIGTLGVKSIDYKLKTENTTPDILSTNKILEKLSEKKINNVIIEASSHGLDQHRLDGIYFDIGIFTNFTRDHLDYHRSYKSYLNAKLILFKRLMKNKGLAVYEDKFNEVISLKKIINKNKLKTFVLGKRDNLKIIRHQYFKNYQSINIIFNNQKFYFKTSLIGKVQIKNLLMAVIAASKVLSIRKIIKSLESVKSVNGRFEEIGKIRNLSRVFLDYSHTPDALRTCINDIKDQFNLSNISIVFGCGGERDKSKRQIMGKIANELCQRIYLTDDNPRNENPMAIRNQIKKKINKNKLFEIPSRDLAIRTAITELKSGDILIVSGKGHENYQEYKDKKKFSDKYLIKKYIKQKNKSLSKYWKNNILNESLKIFRTSNFREIKGISTNSKKIGKNSIFIGLKGKKFDGSKFVNQAVKNNAIISIIDSKTKIRSKKVSKVQNTLKFLSEISSKVRKVSRINAIAITGSAGKTSLKEMLRQSLSKISSTIYSKKSFNNKFGVPLTLFDIKLNNNFGVFEIGMDKKGEIDYLSNIINPNVGVITNISYAHIKNFKNLNEIAKAKSELIDKILPNGYVVLNKDDKYFNFFKSKAVKKNLEIISFSKKKQSDISLYKIKKSEGRFYLKIKYMEKILEFQINKNALFFLENLLASIAVLSIYFDLHKLKKNIFLNFKIPSGRGDLKKISILNKSINIIDESYNSNPLSLDFAIQKYNSISVKKGRKIAILGDMLELGGHAKRLHIQVTNIINKSNIDKVYVYGKYIQHTFNKIKTQKKGKIFKTLSEINKFIKFDLKNGDYLMIKASNATGLSSVVSRIKNYKNAL